MNTVLDAVYNILDIFGLGPDIPMPLALVNSTEDVAKLAQQLGDTTALDAATEVLTQAVASVDPEAIQQAADTLDQEKTRIEAAQRELARIQNEPANADLSGYTNREQKKITKELNKVNDLAMTAVDNAQATAAAIDEAKQSATNFAEGTASVRDVNNALTVLIQNKAGLSESAQKAGVKVSKVVQSQDNLRAAIAKKEGMTLQDRRQQITLTDKLTLTINEDLLRKIQNKESLKEEALVTTDADINQNVEIKATVLVNGRPFLESKVTAEAWPKVKGLLRPLLVTLPSLTQEQIDSLNGAKLNFSITGNAGFVMVAPPLASDSCRKTETESMGFVKVDFTAIGCVRDWEDVGNQDSVLAALDEAARAACKMEGEGRSSSVHCDSPCRLVIGEVSVSPTFPDLSPTLFCFPDGTMTFWRTYTCDRTVACTY